MATLIAKLEGAVEEEKQMLQLINRKEEITLLLSNCQESKQRCEKVYEAANKYLSLTAATSLVKELSSCSADEFCLIETLGQTSQNAIDTNDKLSYNSLPQIEGCGEIFSPKRLDKYRSELFATNKSVGDIFLKVSNFEREVGRLKTELKDQKSLSKDIETKAEDQTAKILEMNEELSLLLKVRKI